MGREDERVAGRRSTGVAAALIVLLWILGPAICAAAAPRAGLHAAGTVVSAQERSAEPLNAENASQVSRQSVDIEPWWKGLARVINFAIVAGVLVYYLRAPIARYLARRSAEIRGDLVKAAETRATAAAEIAAIDEKLKALPGEIEALGRRGAEEIAAEEARIRQAAAVERKRLIEQANREIELQVRAAERDLTRRAAELTVGLASQRIKRSISDDDRARLVDRYLEQLAKGA